MMEGARAEGSGSNYIKYINNLNEANIDPNHPICFPSCNYDTYIVRIGDSIYVDTSNNYDFGINRDKDTRAFDPIKDGNNLKYLDTTYNIEDFNLSYHFDFMYVKCCLIGRELDYITRGHVSKYSDHKCDGFYGNVMILKNENKIVCKLCKKVLYEN